MRPSPSPELTRCGPALLALARASIAERLGPATDADATSDTAVAGDPALNAILRAPGASFVTLTLAGRLRGCIGALEARRPLADDVAANARSAAFGDPRFAPLRREEFDALRIEVSVLSTPEPLAVRSQTDALAQLRPGVDGAILTAGHRRGTFLPQVWESLPEPADFLAQLRRKAGLAPTAAWRPDWRLSRYTVTSFTQPAEEDR
ncbi:MAG: AmmeMemoRadiSam system protein A [Propionibacteriaceae bacterium]|nr:AmmeMemoRadiSam system protein A [Propionibacteriaceae bacterium]